jgi:hypothetical protein
LSGVQARPQKVAEDSIPRQGINRVVWIFFDAYNITLFSDRFKLRGSLIFSLNGDDVLHFKLLRGSDDGAALGPVADGNFYLSSAGGGLAEDKIVRSEKVSPADFRDNLTVGALPVRVQADKVRLMFDFGVEATGGQNILFAFGYAVLSQP